MASTHLDSAKPGQNPTARRAVLLGAGAAGAAAIAAKTLPGASADVAAAVAAKPVPEGIGGYQLTPHVLRYYETAKV
jgi:hypothetical protein